MSSILRKDRLPATNYTIVSNEALRDTRLSFKARGLLSYLTSHSEGWEVSITSIASQNGCGESQVKSALKELRDLGYLRLERHTSRGRVIGWEYVMLDPHGPGVDSPHVEKPHVDFAHVGNEHTKEEQFQEDHLLEDQLVSLRSTGRAKAPSSGKGRRKQRRDFEDYTDDFNAWYGQYPRHVAKRPGFDAYREAIKRVDYETLMAATKAFAVAVEGKPKDKIPHPATWLNGDRWLDDTTSGQEIVW